MYLKKTLRCSIALTAALLANSFLLQSAHAADPKIMVVGDSISAGYMQPSYRRALYRSLQAQDCAVDMVGDQKLTSYGFNRPAENPGIDYPSLAGFNPPYPAGATWSKDNPADDTDHQAFGGIRADQIAAGTGDNVKPIGDYIDAEQPDYVLLHAGTNDLGIALDVGEVFTEEDIPEWATKTTNDIFNIIRAIFDSHDNAPGVRIIVGNFIPRKGETVQQFVDLEVAMNIAYREELTQRIDDFDDPRVKLADVATGFDSDAMTTDGVHPNAVGEQHLAGAFEFALAELGLCSLNYAPEVDYQLPHNTWSLLSLPAALPPGLSTVQALFADDIPAGVYGTNWGVRLYNPATDGYEDPGLNGTLLPGQGFWIIQMTNSTVTLDMPARAGDTPTQNTPACTALSGCYTKTLTGDALGTQWNALGNPFYTSPAVSSMRVTTDSSVCPTAAGCTIAEAGDSGNANLLMDQFYWYDGSGYQQIGAGDTFTPWRGYYGAVLTGAAGVNTVLHIPRN